MFVPFRMLSTLYGAMVIPSVVEGAHVHRETRDPSTRSEWSLDIGYSLPALRSHEGRRMGWILDIARSYPRFGLTRLRPPRLDR